LKQYVDLINKILAEGEERGDRTGTGTLSIFGGDLKFDLRERFPLVTIKKTLYKSAFIEMLWFIRGEPNTAYLKKHNVNIWDDWADKDGNLGRIYGCQWRSWAGKIRKFSGARLLLWAWKNDPSYDPEVDKYVSEKDYIGQEPGWRSDETYNLYQERIDQLANLIDGIKKNPTGRRHIVTAWQVADLDTMGLPPCHYLFQCYVSNDGHLDLKISKRSTDVGLGLPFNIAQYALLTHLIARATGLKARHLLVSLGDAHLYSTHIEAIKEIINRQPKNCNPKLIFKTDNIDIDGYKPEDFEIEGYESHPFIKLPIAV
jgi:thymidylate synthase